MRLTVPSTVRMLDATLPSGFRWPCHPYLRAVSVTWAHERRLLGTMDRLFGSITSSGPMSRVSRGRFPHSLDRGWWVALLAVGLTVLATSSCRAELLAPVEDDAAATTGDAQPDVQARARFQIRGQACSKSAGLVIDASGLAGLHSVVAS